MVQKISANDGGWGNDIGRGEYTIALNLNNGTLHKVRTIEVMGLYPIQWV